MNTVRCAIYTRKSTEEGLDQVFNTLDAQREACEAYVKSQAGEGWRALPARYDDGGFSGGNMDRPAIKRLLADVDCGNIDAIVVYKVDRLTRSLMDFSGIVQRLDSRGVSFVSVTQAFNTTTSMGRLTLNVLLSFAQFERDVTGERIRDKIAASKAKGMWMGGNVPLGYDLCERRLVVNAEEAAQVRHIFARYLELRSGVELVRELASGGYVSKRGTSRSGRQRGGQPFNCGAIYYLLQNRIYRGEIVHRGVRHAGEHQPIVGEELFDSVQEALRSNRSARRARPTRSGECPLAGLVVDADGQWMGTSFSYGRGGRMYRYYVSGSLDPARPMGSPRPLRIAAGPLEKLVATTLGRLLGRQLTWSQIRIVLQQIELRNRSIQLLIDPASVLEPYEPVESALERLRPEVAPDRLEAEEGKIKLILDRAPSFRGGRTRAEADASLSQTAINGAAILRAAHKLLNQHAMSPLAAEHHREASAPPFQRQRQIMSVGLLCPSIQKAMLQGRGATMPKSGFHTLPLAWADQRALLRPS